VLPDSGELRMAPFLLTPGMCPTPDVVERPSQHARGRAVDLEGIVAPSTLRGFGRSPLLPDVDPADDGNRAVDHEQLAVVAVEDAPQSEAARERRHRGELVHLCAGVEERVPKARGRVEAADRVSAARST
jgi:hypothetical protein